MSFNPRTWGRYAQRDGAMSSPNVLDVNPEEVQLVHNIASLVHVQDNTLDPYYTLEVAVVKHGDLHSTGVLGNKVSVLEPHTITCPFVLERNEGVDLVVFAIKHRGDLHYYYGAPIDAVAAFKPPTPPATFSEESMFITVKTSSTSAKSAKVLENTESMPSLKNNTVLILKNLGMFKSLALTSLEKISKWVLEASFKQVVKKVLTEAEGRERKLAAEKAQKAGEKEREINRALALEATKVWADIEKKLMEHAPFYSDGFPQRIFIMENADALDKCVEDLAKHQLRAWLIPALKAHAAAVAAGGVVPVAPATPLKRLLEPPPPAPELLEAPAAAAAYGSADGNGAGGEGDLDAGHKDTSATDATANGNANADGDNPTAKGTATDNAKQPSRASSRRQQKPEGAEAAAEAAPPPAASKRQTQTKPPKRDRNDLDGGVPPQKAGRQKLFPDIGDDLNSNPDPDPPPAQPLSRTRTRTRTRTLTWGEPPNCPTLRPFPAFPREPFGVYPFHNGKALRCRVLRVPSMPSPHLRDPNPNPSPNPFSGEGATVQQSDRMLAKIKELTAANEKFQGTISSLNEQLTKAKAGNGAEVDELKAKVQAQEVQIATLKTTVEYSGKLHTAFMTGLTMQRPGATFASPAFSASSASSASTATPPPHAPGGIGGLFVAGVD